MGSLKIYSKSDLDLIEAGMHMQARRSFWAYRQYMHPKMIKGWWQREVAQELQRFYLDFLSGQRPILLIQAPPQHGKTEQVVDFLSWLLGQLPETKMIYSSFSERLGIRANLTLQRMMTGRKYAGVFPELSLPGRGNGDPSAKLRNRDIIELRDSVGYFRNTTVRGAVTGEGLDLGIIDDPIKGREEANSLAIRDRTWDWFTDDFFSRFADHAGLLGIMTRWHIDDPFGRLIDSDPRVRVLRYPAIAEVDEQHRKAGEPLFPEHKSLEFLLARKRIMHHANWEALYQQNPTIVGGGLFKDAWWGWYDTPPRIMWRSIYADTAQKTKEENDYSVFQCWGATDDGRAVMLDQIRGKWEAPELLTHARSFWNKHKSETGKGVLRAMKVEDKVSGTGLIQTLRREGVPTVAIPRDTDKVMRAMDASPSVESGLVLLPRGAPWVSDYLSELSQFPNGKNDDQVDPTVDAIVDILNIQEQTTAGVW